MQNSDYVENHLKYMKYIVNKLTASKVEYNVADSISRLADAN